VPDRSRILTSRLLQERVKYLDIKTLAVVVQ